MPDQLQAARWLDASMRRHSRRSFDGTAVSAADLDALEALAARFRPYPNARAVLVRSASAKVFAGIVGAYGGIAGAPSALVFAGGTEDAAEAVGYTGEALVLEATALGLSTCWVGGLFSASSAGAEASLRPGERAYAISPVGHAVARATARERLLFGTARVWKRRSIDEIAPGAPGWPAWAARAADAVRVAPSAMNRQPWRLRLEDRGLVMAFDGADSLRISKRLDCGIAMLHAEVAAMAEGVTGRWELLRSPEVAVFVPGPGD